jgi:hypothetical protein
MAKLAPETETRLVHVAAAGWGAPGLLEQGWNVGCVPVRVMQRGAVNEVGLRPDALS